MSGHKHRYVDTPASGIPRNELYLTSKLVVADHGPEDVRRSFDQTLEELGVDHLDLFLIHWPLPTLYSGDYVSTWQTHHRVRH